MLRLQAPRHQQLSSQDDHALTAILSPRPARKRQNSIPETATEKVKVTEMPVLPLREPKEDGAASWCPCTPATSQLESPILLQSRACLLTDPAPAASLGATPPSLSMSYNLGSSCQRRPSGMPFSSAGVPISSESLKPTQHCPAIQIPHCAAAVCQTPDVALHQTFCSIPCNPYLLLLHACHVLKVSPQVIVGAIGGSSAAFLPTCCRANVCLQLLPICSVLDLGVLQQKQQYSMDGKPAAFLCG